jgi:hypothetical protein
MPSYTDGDRHSLLQVRSSRKRAPHNSVFVIEQLYTRSYASGENAIRVSGQVWLDGVARPDDYDLRSAQKMWPNLILECKPPLEPEEAK